MSPTNTDSTNNSTAPVASVQLTNMAFSAIQVIAEKEPELAEQLIPVLKHIAGTYSDKYSEGGKNDTKENDLYEVEAGKVINIYQTRRYIQRYNTKGFPKSENPVDLHKAIHYLVFELVRRNRQDSLGQMSDNKISN